MQNKGHIRTFRSKKLHPEHVKLINEAIRHNARGKEKDVHITYRKENGEVSERKVRPLAVKGKSLFVAHCHERNAIRSFRVERITMVKRAFWDGFEKRAGLMTIKPKEDLAFLAGKAKDKWNNLSNSDLGRAVRDIPNTGVTQFVKNRAADISKSNAATKVRRFFNR